MAQQGIRIIGGHWRQSVLKVRHLPGLRPTLVRLRKTLADWMRPHQPLSVLDVFAGTGAVGFELASQGAERVVLVEKHPLAVADLRANVDRLQGAAECIEVVAGDSMQWLEHQQHSFDLVVVDPPFRSDFGAIVSRVCCSRVCSETTRIYSEQPRRSVVPIPKGWQLDRCAEQGEVSAQLWVRSATNNS